jgi:hypothetical protein
VKLGEWRYSSIAQAKGLSLDICYKQRAKDSKFLKPITMRAKKKEVVSL